MIRLIFCVGVTMSVIYHNNKFFNIIYLKNFDSGNLKKGYKNVFDDAKTVYMFVDLVNIRTTSCFYGGGGCDCKSIENNIEMH